MKRMTEKFFYDPNEEEEGPLGVAEKFGACFCMDCNPFTGELLTDNRIELIDKFICSQCGIKIG